MTGKKQECCCYFFDFIVFINKLFKFNLTYYEKF